MIVGFVSLNEIRHFSKSLRKLFNGFQISLCKIKRKARNPLNRHDAESHAYAPNLTITPFKLNKLFLNGFNLFLNKRGV